MSALTDNFYRAMEEYLTPIEKYEISEKNEQTEQYNERLDDAKKYLEDCIVELSFVGSPLVKELDTYLRAIEDEKREV